jgi:hypothetical protein
MTFLGRVENGLVVLDGSVALPEGAPVKVELLLEKAEAEDNGPTLYDRLQSVIGKAQGLPPDAAENTDHYLYGQPKK